ncbi:MAG: hypothetical protein FJW23_12735, partial [Acidimicrobiia bacterium]|nr:hypothetical protein [Acidimicrobiia bacterium]
MRIDVSHGAKLCEACGRGFRVLRSRVRGGAAAGVFGAAALLPACGGESGVVTPAYDEGTGALVRIDYDYDSDGRVDVQTFLDDGRVVRLEGDSDADGLVDRWEYYDENGELARLGGSSQADGIEDSWLYQTGDDRRVEISTARDGVVDRTEYYRQDVLVRTETDTNGDGRTDVWEEYEDDVLRVVAIDEGGSNGRPTRRIVYGAGVQPRLE